MIWGGTLIYWVLYQNGDNTIQHNTIRIEASESNKMRKCPNWRPYSKAEGKMVGDRVLLGSEKERSSWPSRSSTSLPLGVKSSREFSPLHPTPSPSKNQAPRNSGLMNQNINSLTPSALHDVMIQNTNNKKTHKSHDSGIVDIVIFHENRGSGINYIIFY